MRLVSHAFRRWRPLLHVVLFTLVAATGARAHDPFELTTIAQLTSDALLLEITATRSTAMKLALSDSQATGFDPANFEEHKPALAACAPALFDVSAGGETLEMQSVAVSLGVENDVEWRLRYPRPTRGPLRLHAPHVPKLGAGFGNLLTAHTRDGALLGQTLLMDTEITFIAELPASALGAPVVAKDQNLPKPSPIAANEATSRGSASSPLATVDGAPSASSFRPALAAFCAVVIVLLILWSKKRDSARR